MVLVIRNRLRSKECSAPVPCAGISMKSRLPKSPAPLACLETPYNIRSNVQRTRGENCHLTLALQLDRLVSGTSQLSQLSSMAMDTTPTATCLGSVTRKLDRSAA